MKANENHKAAVGASDRVGFEMAAWAGMNGRPDNFISAHVAVDCSFAPGDGCAAIYTPKQVKAESQIVGGTDCQIDDKENQRNEKCERKCQ